MPGDLCGWRSTWVPDDKRMKVVQERGNLWAKVTSFVIANGMKEEAM